MTNRLRIRECARKNGSIPCQRALAKVGCAACGPNATVSREGRAAGLGAKDGAIWPHSIMPSLRRFESLEFSQTIKIQRTKKTAGLSHRRLFIQAWLITVRQQQRLQRQLSSTA